MTQQPRCGFLILDRKGEYIRDTIDQSKNPVPGLHHHPKARERMVIVSRRDYSTEKQQGRIFDYIQPQFNIADIDPTDLVDFLRGWTPQQEDLLHDYGHIEHFYEKLLGETPFGLVDKHTWFVDFPGLFEVKDKGKKLLKQFEGRAAVEQRDELLEEEEEQLQDHLTGTKSGMLERIAGKIKRFCQNPFFGGSQKGVILLKRPSCVNLILRYLSEGKCVFIDMQGQSDENYTIVAALFARRLLTTNKAQSDDEHHIRACLVMEEAHNILSAEELEKGNGRGSVFIELAREGRSNKLGFVLVTQQPDIKSIDLQVVKTIDTVVAFHMPLDDARHIQRLKTGFAGLELEISNAPKFQGVAIADAGPIPFQSTPIGEPYMQYCADGLLATMIENRHESTVASENEQEEKQRPYEHVPSVEERLARLMQQRREAIQDVALATLKAWKDDDGALRETAVDQENSVSG